MDEEEEQRLSPFGGEEERQSPEGERRILLARKIMNAAAAAAVEELLPFLAGKNEHQASLIENELEPLAAKFLGDVKETTSLYKRKCLPVLEGDTPVPLRVREKSDELVTGIENGGRRRLSATAFAQEIKSATVRLLDDAGQEDGDEDYRGLDSDRDTEEEVTNILRMYPEAMGASATTSLGPLFPGLLRSFDSRNVAFIPLVVRLRLEYRLLSVARNRQRRFVLRQQSALADERAELVRLGTFRNLMTTRGTIEEKRMFDVFSVDVLRELMRVGPNGLARNTDGRKRRRL